MENFFEHITGGSTVGRVARLDRIISELSETELTLLRVVECGDEYTGVRFGHAKCRVGRCEKLGGGGRNKGQRYAYQAWADWS